MVTADERLSVAARQALLEPGAELFVSAVIAWEYADLHTRGRLPLAAAFDVLTAVLALQVVDVPAAIWRLAASLPDIHRDPVDRILIAHALHDGMTLVTADEKIRRYAVPAVW